MFACLQWQIESAQTEEGFFIRKWERGFDAFLVNFHAEDFQVWVHAPETGGGLKRRTRVEAVAEINEHRISEQVIRPREKRWLIEQDKVVDAAESIRSGLPACQESFRLFRCADVWHTLILSVIKRLAKISVD
jgi:hypothetical protein